MKRLLLEQHPEQRDVDSHSKLRQEQLFWEYHQKYGFDLVVLRPGVIYGPGGGHFSNRVGLQPLRAVPPHLGGKNLLPLTYVDNCAEAIVVAALSEGSSGQVYNVVDDDLPTSGQYLSLYKKQRSPGEVGSGSLLRADVGLADGGALQRAVEGTASGDLHAYKTRAMWAETSSRTLS